MASSFQQQIPGILHLIAKLSPRSVLDIGKGFGKYGFLIHEYIGINNQVQLKPQLKMKDQSRIKIDAVEIDNDLLLPHLDHIYNKVINGDVLKLYAGLGAYDLVLMIDIIEHIGKPEAIAMLRLFLEKGSTVIIATPKEFFEQCLYESEYERHVSHWTVRDFKNLGQVDYQYYGPGAVYLLSDQKLNIRGFGNSFTKKLRRIGNAIKSEL